MRSNKFISLLLSLASCIAITACSGSSDEDDNLVGEYTVEDVNILANDVEVGESVRVEVFFESKIEDDGSPDGLDVVIRIPPELQYVTGSSDIYDGSTDASDQYTPTVIESCPTGETFLSYQFSDLDLFDREISTFGKFGLRLQVRGVTPIQATLIGASAARVQEYFCGEFFDAEKNEAVQVLN